MTFIRIFGIIIYKFRYKQEFCFIVLLLINEKTDVNFYYIILLLNLAICRRLNSSRKLLFNAKKII